MLKRIVTIILAMSGILVDKLSPLRVLLLMIISGGVICSYIFAREINFMTALFLFVFIFFIRYIFLFFSFTKRGVAYFLKKKFGESYGYDLYQTITAVLFFLGATGFSLLVNKSVGFLFPSFLKNPVILNAIGIPVIMIGLITNVWSTVIVGIDVYYYKDLFLGRKIGDFKKEGPYNLLSNPMYSIGQASGYGTAIISASLPGIVVIFLNQILMYVFYLIIEKPHIRKILATT